jgi:Ca2+-binding RTX toxin-like protein
VFSPILRVGSGANLGNITVTNEITGSTYGTLSLATAGAIVDSHAGNDLTVANLALTASSGIGAADAFETHVNTLAFRNRVGSAVNINNEGSLTIGALQSVTSSSNSGTSTTITTTGSLSVATDVTSAGTLTLTALDSAAAGDDLTINAGDTVESTSGAVVLNAGDNLTLGTSATVHAAAPVLINVDFGNADLGVGGTADLRNGTITGSSIIVSGAGDGDTFFGSGAAEQFFGLAGEDAFTGGGGNDTVTGGADADRVNFSGNRGDYLVELLPGGDIRVTDLRSGSPDGTDTVREVENFAFADGAFTSATVLNAPPALGGDDSITVPEGGTVVVTTADLTATDADNTAAQLVYSITGTSHGSVLLSGSPTTNFTQADLAANLVAFQHDCSELDGSFSVNLTDGTSTPQSATVTATVSPHVNDAPIATITNASYAAAKNVSLDLKNTGLSISDVDGGAGVETVTLSVGEGALHVTPGTSGAVVTNSDTASVTINGTVAQINSLLNTDGTSEVSYIDSSASPSPSTTLTLLVHDNGNTGGSDLSASDAATINISSSNQPPTDISGGPLTVNEDSASGTLVGTVTGIDPDSPILTYTLIDDAGGRFTIDNAGHVTVANGLLLDFEQSATHGIVVRATDEGGLFVDKAFAIAVNDLNPEVAIGGPGADTLYGGFADDTINGLGGDDVLVGGGGNDYITSGGGQDTALGEAGNDTVIGADGADYLNGGADDDLIVGNDGADTLLGDAGNDYLDGGTGDDLVMGGAGNDTVLGADGNDYVNGEGGDDLVFGGDGIDTLLGADGNDYLNGENGNDTIFGDGGNDTVIGGEGNDYLSGEAGDDNLVGGNGNDTLFAGSGSDYLQGDAGDDFFVFEQNFGASLIIDFETGTAAHHDIIQFKGGVFSDFPDVLAHAVQQATNVVITASTGDSLTLANVQIANLVVMHNSDRRIVSLCHGLNPHLRLQHGVGVIQHGIYRLGGISVFRGFLRQRGGPWPDRKPVRRDGAAPFLLPF